MLGQRSVFRRPSVWAALLVACVLAACGPKGGGDQGDVSSDQGAEAGAPQADGPCGAVGPLMRLACGETTLEGAAERLTRAAETAQDTLSPDGRRLLQQGLEEWVAAQRVACGAAADAAPSGDAVPCLDAALAERAKRAETLVEDRAGFVFQRVETARAQQITQDIATRLGLGEGAPTAMTQTVAFPRIDNPRKNPAIQRFNDAVEQRLGSEGDTPTEQLIDYTIAFASPEIVSVRFDTYENTLGAAHPNAGARAVTVLMRTGEPIGPQDVFVAGSGWEDFLTQRALGELSAVFDEFGAGPPEEGDVRDTATKTHNWVIGEAGLTLLFPPYSIGPHALGPQEVTIPWKDLRKFLNPQAPAPVGRG